MRRIGESYNQPKNTLKPMCKYISFQNENEAINFLDSKGYDVQNKREVEEALLYHLGDQKRKGKFQKALTEVLELHPDKELIDSFLGEPEQSNKYSSYDETTKKESFWHSPYCKPLIVVGVAILLIIVITKS
jgi:hypothetical protein